MLMGIFYCFIILKVIFETFIFIDIQKSKLIQTLNMHHLLILINSVFNKNYNHLLPSVVFRKNVHINNT